MPAIYEELRGRSRPAFVKADLQVDESARGVGLSFAWQGQVQQLVGVVACGLTPGPRKELLNRNNWISTIRAAILSRTSSVLAVENENTESVEVQEVIVTILSPALKPWSTLIGSQPILATASSFSARTTLQVPPNGGTSVL